VANTIVRFQVKSYDQFSLNLFNSKPFKLLTHQDSPGQYAVVAERLAIMVLRLIDDDDTDAETNYDIPNVESDQGDSDSDNEGTDAWEDSDVEENDQTDEEDDCNHCEESDADSDALLPFVPNNIVPHRYRDVEDGQKIFPVVFSEGQIAAAKSLHRALRVAYKAVQQVAFQGLISSIFTSPLKTEGPGRFHTALEAFLIANAIDPYGGFRSVLMLSTDFSKVQFLALFSVLIDVVNNASPEKCVKLLSYLLLKPLC